jgi:hypothetical protein
VWPKLNHVKKNLLAAGSFLKAGKRKITTAGCESSG